MQVSGSKDEAVQQPLWLSDGSLAFISDRDFGWWNLWRETSPGTVKPILQKNAEFGYPPWVFGYHTYQQLSDGRYAAGTEWLLTYSRKTEPGNTRIMKSRSE